MIKNNYDSNHIRVLHICMILEKGMATHLNILAWRIPWTEEPGGLQSIGSQSQTWLNNQYTDIYMMTQEGDVGDWWGRERKRNWYLLWNCDIRFWRFCKSRMWWWRLVGWRFSEELQFEARGSLFTEFPLAGEGQAFNCVNDTHVHYAGEGALLKVHQFQCFFQPKTIIMKTFRMFDQVSGHHGQAKLTHKINHHSNQPSLTILWMLVLSEYYLKSLINSIIGHLHSTVEDTLGMK